MGNEYLPVLAAVTGGGYLLFVRRRPGLAGLCVAFAMCFRLDAGLAAASIGVVEWLRQKRFPWFYAFIGLGVLAGWLLFLQAYYGRIIPMTIVGKKALRPVSYTLQEWRTLTQSLPPWICVLLLVGAIVGLVAIACRGPWANPLVAAIGLWLAAHEIAYRLVGVWFAPWYFQHLQNAILLLFVVGAWWACGIVRSKKLRPWVVAVALLPVLIPSLIFVASSWRRPPDPRLEVYRATGNYIRSHLPPDTEVLAIEIGVLGYYCERRILDYGALISPSFATAKLQGARAQLVARLMPDAIVDVPINTTLSEAISQPKLRERYVEVATFTHPDYRGKIVLLVRGNEDAGSPF
jgi:hypothetical protein